ncbi:hypothetical protein HSX10_07460 [Winogradskyella undariae]|uniref:hypothetical protein n=1 Tax=Winogradskyella undariae TaxID=1285465 RepID=UPI00156B722E|nr:hypothetical protein [Winogradskyella undariae]NRR91398.1 hypothetical protein [Winogradskyella undariae]
MNLKLLKLLFQWDREKLNKISRFIQDLFKEINEEIAKFFEEKGVLKIITLLILPYIIYHFYPESIPYSAVVLVVFLGFLKIKLGESSKISSVIIIFGGVAFGAIIISSIWVLLIKPIFNWVLMLFN